MHFDNVAFPWSCNCPNCPLVDPSVMLLQVVSIVSVLFVVVSIVTFCLKTHHTMKIPVVRNTTFQRAIDDDDVTCRRGVTSSPERRGFPVTSKRVARRRVTGDVTYRHGLTSRMPVTSRAGVT